MGSASQSLFLGMLPILLLCMLMLLPMFMADDEILPGGWRDRSVSDPDVKAAATVAVNHYNEGSNSIFYSRALAILKARSQVVEGENYDLKILMVSTECKKQSKPGSLPPDLEHCRLPPRTEQLRQMCEFHVWSRLWLNDTHVTSMNCRQATP